MYYFANAEVNKIDSKLLSSQKLNESHDHDSPPRSLSTLYLVLFTLEHQKRRNKGISWTK